MAKSKECKSTYNLDKLWNGHQQKKNVEDRKFDGYDTKAMSVRNLSGTELGEKQAPRNIDNLVTWVCRKIQEN